MAPLSYAERVLRFAGAHGGISFNEARRLDRALGGTGSSPATALRRAASTEEGARLLAYHGSDGRRLAARETAERAADLRSRTFGAVVDLREGRYTTAGEAERAYDLAPGTIRRELGSEPACGGGAGDAAMIMRLVTRDGPVLVVVASETERQLVGAHLHAVSRALTIGSDTPLRKFRRVEVAGYRLEVRLPQLQALYELGELTGGPYPELRGVTGAAA